MYDRLPMSAGREKESMGKNWFDVDKNGLAELQDPYGRRLTNVQEKIIHSEYLAGKSINDLRRVSGLGERLIRNALRRTKTKKRTKTQAKLLFYKTPAGMRRALAHGKEMKKYSVNESFFSEPLNPISAYVYGFWLADGHIESRNKNLLVFDQMENEILLKIKKALNATNPIHNKGDKGYRLSISSRQLCGDIRKINSFTSSKPKSLVADYPSIPSKLDSHFIRGVFDGDGCISMRHTQLTFMITGTQKLNKKIQEKLIENCGVKKTKIHLKSTFSILSYAGNLQVPRIFNWLYKDAEIYLERKKNYYNKWKNNYDRWLNERMV